jgi:hypothetical protein
MTWVEKMVKPRKSERESFIVGVAKLVDCCRGTKED